MANTLVPALLGNLAKEVFEEENMETICWKMKRCVVEFGSLQVLLLNFKCSIPIIYCELIKFAWAIKKEIEKYIQRTWADLTAM